MTVKQEEIKIVAARIRRITKSSENQHQNFWDDLDTLLTLIEKDHENTI